MIPSHEASSPVGVQRRGGGVGGVFLGCVLYLDWIQSAGLDAWGSSNWRGDDLQSVHLCDACPGLGRGNCGDGVIAGANGRLFFNSRPVDLASKVEVESSPPD